MTALSILELVRVTEDTDARGALDNARDLAVHAENWGYRRIWVAKHHNMPGIASAATWSDNKGHAGITPRAFARLSPRPSRDSVSGHRAAVEVPV